MKISLDWLADYVNWDDEPAALAEKLTAAGLNVEGVEDYRRSFPGVVVARVVHREQHPRADRLSLCRVDDGSGEPVQVVCGAPNVREGLAVLFARVGARLPGGVKLKRAKLRGVDSMGMICSERELELGEDRDGIVELETDLPPGTPADELYGFRDTVLDIEVTPNRPDWLSHLGVAREVAAIYGGKVSRPPAWTARKSGESLGVALRIEDYADCPRYTAHGARGLQIGPSPDWMQNRLRAVGSRPISNVVDITNYVLLETGQPLHAFDRARIDGGTLTIRRAERDLPVVTLDDQERTAPAGTILICDESRAVGLGGIMGLANSVVSADTREILLESAFFSPGRVRASSRGMGLVTDASYRFERGADWNMVERAARRALHLFEAHAGAQVVADWSDRGDPDRRAAANVPLRVWQVNRVLGTRIGADEAALMLQSLGLKVQPMGNPQARSANAVNMMVEVPSFRRDIAAEADLIEEIARRWGYDRLGGEGAFRVGGGGRRSRRDEVAARCRTWLAARGFHEIVTSSFQLPDEAEIMRLPPDDPLRHVLGVVEAHHGGGNTLRTSLLPSLLDVARRNANAGAEPPLLFQQQNRTYRPGTREPEPEAREDDRLLPGEPEFLQFAIVGEAGRGPDDVPLDLLQVKGTVAALAAELRVTLRLVPGGDRPWLLPGGQWRIEDAEGREVGHAGRLHPEVLAAADLELPAAVAEIRREALLGPPEPVRFRPFTRFPAVKRDLSLLVPDGVAYAALEETVRTTAGDLLESVELFDIYRGTGIPAGRRAFGIRLQFRSAKGNLKGKTVDAALDRVVAALADRLQVEHRAQG